MEKRLAPFLRTRPRGGHEYGIGEGIFFSRSPWSDRGTEPTFSVHHDHPVP